jgi:glycosyltransferase involved in cell wall biosynthesis
LRIVFVNSMRAFGGGERWVLEAAEGLRARGHDVSVAARAKGALAGRARAAGHAVLELPMSGDLDVVSAGRLAVWMRRRRVELVCAGIQRAVRVSCAAAKLARVRAVVERRGLALPVRHTALNRAVYGSCVTRVVVNCRALADDLSGLVPPSRITVIPNGIDPSRLARGGGAALRAALGIPAGAPVIAVLGRLTTDKGHGDALAAFAIVRGRLPDARLLIVGSGKLEGELRREALALCPGGAVLFTGHVDDVGAAIEAAGVVMVTSLREGMPHVVLEAMALGTPVVATAVAGIPEMIEHGRSGLLTPPAAPAAAASAVLSVLTDPALARSLADQARRRVAEEFALTTMIDRIDACFGAEIATAAGEERGA